MKDIVLTMTISALGYGSRALELLMEYYHGRVPCLKEETDFNAEAKVKHVKVISFLKQSSQLAFHSELTVQVKFRGNQFLVYQRRQFCFRS